MRHIYNALRTYLTSFHFITLRLTRICSLQQYNKKLCCSCISSTFDVSLTLNYFELQSNYKKVFERNENSSLMHNYFKLLTREFVQRLREILWFTVLFPWNGNCTSMKLGKELINQRQTFTETTIRGISTPPSAWLSFSRKLFCAKCFPTRRASNRFAGGWRQ